MIRAWRARDGRLLSSFQEETGTDVFSLDFRRGGLFAYGRWDATIVLAKTPAFCEPCDANCDGTINPFDTEPFIDGLMQGGKGCSPCAGDANEDGTTGHTDVEVFITCLSQTS